MHRILGALVVLAIGLTAGGLDAAPGAAGERRLPARCGPATRRVGEPVRGSTPVLFVHGFAGRPGDFRRRLTSRPSLLEAVSGIEGVAPYVFDYAAAADEWVTDDAIGPALARSIVCLRRASGRRVVVVAHSMGGLATRFAQGQSIRGEAVSASVARVITIGTPTRGVILLSFTSGEIGDELVQLAADALGDSCDDPPGGQRRRLCALLEAANAPGVSAMTPESTALADLPPWAPGTAVRPIATDLGLRLSVFGLGTTVSLGDVVATVSSATADGTRRRRVFGCHTELVELLDVIDESACSHTNQLANRRVVETVLADVRRAVAAPRRRDAGVNRSGR